VLGASIRFTPAEIAEYYRARVPGLKQQSGCEWRAPCPIHRGKDLNFSVNTETGQWFCHSQCGRGGDLFDLEEALHGGDFLTRKAEIFRLIGRSQPTKPAKPTQGGWREEARYAYTDENGGLLYEVIRYRKPDGAKTFVQVRPSGVERAGTTDPERSGRVPTGGLVIGLDKGKYMPDARASRASGKPTWKRVSDQLDYDGAEYRFRECPRVPYRLPRVLEAETVFLPEGEKDVEMLEGWSLTASCNPGGSGSTHLYARWLDFFRNRHIVILPDNDAPGRKHAAAVAEQLLPVAASLRVVELLDRAGREGERAFCLQAWNGDTGHTIDRIGRGTIHVEHCCMSMVGGIQPGRLRSYLVDALEDGPSNDGLVQRFQVLVWPDTASDWRYVDRPVNAASQQRAEQAFRSLIELDAEAPARFQFDAGAQELFVAWLQELEAKVRGEELHPALVSHLSKYRKLMPALALLFELAERAGQSSEGFVGAPRGVDLKIRLDQARRAAAWCEYLESHARRVYSCVVTPQLRAARELAEKIRSRKVGAHGFFSCREVYLKGWSGLDSPEAVKLAAEVLEDAGWVRSLATECGPLGGRPSNRYEVNPRVWEQP
jgi:hypothetical protein